MARRKTTSVSEEQKTAVSQDEFVASEQSLPSVSEMEDMGASDHDELLLATHEETPPTELPVTEPAPPFKDPTLEGGEVDIEEELRTIPLIPPQDKFPTVPQLLIAIALLAGVLGYPTLQQFAGQPVTAKSEATVQESQPPQPPPPPPEVEQPKDLFADIVLEAKAAYVWDITEQRAIYKQNASEQLPLASLTKLMTALVALETYGPNADIPITLSAISQEGENGFHDGDLWRAKDLIDFTLMTSSNDGAYALAAAGAALVGESSTTAPFLKRMNAKAEEIGLTQTYFVNPTGLDESLSQSGGYGSARDMAFLMEYIIKNAPQILKETTKATATFTDESGTPFTATNTNDAISQIPAALGSKTGYTVLAGGNLVVAFEVAQDHPVVISVLGSTRDGRFRDVEALRTRVLEAYQTNQ